MYDIVLKIYSFKKGLVKCLDSIAHGCVTKEKQGSLCLWDLTQWEIVSHHWIPFIRIQESETPLSTYSYVNVYILSVKSINVCWKTNENKKLSAQEWGNDVTEETLTKPGKGRII